METKKFSILDIDVIKEDDQLNSDQLSAIIGGKVGKEQIAGDCKCGDVNCNVN